LLLRGGVSEKAKGRFFICKERIVRNNEAITRAFQGHTLAMSREGGDGVARVSSKRGREGGGKLRNEDYNALGRSGLVVQKKESGAALDKQKSPEARQEGKGKTIWSIVRGEESRKLIKKYEKLGRKRRLAAEN